MKITPIPVGVVGENWANIHDPVERRRAQNRIAQRGYRRRLRKGEERNTAQASAATLPSPPQQQHDQVLPPPPLSLPPPLQSYSLHPPTPPTLPSDVSPYTSPADPLMFTGEPWDPPLSLDVLFPDPVAYSAYPSPLALPLPDLLHEPTPGLTPEPTSSGSPTLTSTTEGRSGPAHGHTALHRAALHGHESVLAVLLRAGGDPSLPDSAGWTPLHLAARQGHTRVVQLLLTSDVHHRGAVNRTTRRGETAFHLAVQARQHAVVRVLLEHPASYYSVNAQDCWGRTPLHLACESNQQELVEMLILAGAQLDIRDFEDQTPLHSACLGGSH
ncbi:hypothetical protein ASPACDRAFT_1883919 [Aspergillus aculeatus ATCC 16872]|uniref:Uncharacterized protein n=1 Tax=Aspergillus aculeatus (strain ATCC 16872 / CBS 172.66 / WB 5094) TaxID=690307 RepID=A0A1L9WET5_ASPA1|nr:uncharacterized protein ASPACDRAFT_1883919 [Aspergillus aculeatus ATCC 16872]OJJ94681.1 hypothetical protein ASPACDRAFT_1883919 [Aspergillus aculeatus ATCC 16872]